VPPLDAHHHAVEGGERLLELQPAEPASPGLIHRSGILDHQPLVAPLAGVVEMPVHLVGGARAGEMRIQEPLAAAVGQAELLQRSPTLAQRRLEQISAVEVQEIEGDEHHGHRVEQFGAGIDSPEPRLQAGEVEDCAGPIRNQLAVDHQPMLVPRGR